MRMRARRYPVTGGALVDVLVRMRIARSVTLASHSAVANQAKRAIATKW